MREGWTTVFRTVDPVEAAIIRGVMVQNQIPVAVMNAQDSCFHFLGEISLMVPERYSVIARCLASSELRINPS